MSKPVYTSHRMVATRHDSLLVSLVIYVTRWLYMLYVRAFVLHLVGTLPLGRVGVGPPFCVFASFAFKINIPCQINSEFNRKIRGHF